ncbi:MAG: DNA polymerase III subunit beta [Nitrospirae bacterium]|nr:DNA polymerase III subunit beta [Nitrospirota bacterium]MDA8214521.1 DNA polymerase III subunit beta [Nitrospiraceae bacterium]
MKVTVEKDELQKKLSDIQNIVEKKNTMPILNHFLLAAEKEGAYITATDLETAFKEPIKLNIAEEGRMCIPARKLFEIVREMDGELILESADSQWVKVKSGKSNFRMSCLSAEEFPVWPGLETTEEMEIPSSLLLEMIDKSIYAAGESDTRYVLNGLLFHIKPDGKLTVVGTDGHRLALSERSIGATSGEEKKLIISRKSVAELRRFLSDEAKELKVVVGKNHILFKIDNIQFLTRLIEGTYPNYEQVIPTANEKILTVDKNLLIKSLRRVSIMSKERSNAVKVDIDSSNMVISASNPDLGEASDEIAVNYSGDAMTVAFNARYVLDALNVMASEKVILKLNEPLSPAMIMEEGGEDYKCVVMPMRL